MSYKASFLQFSRPNLLSISWIGRGRSLQSPPQSCLQMLKSCLHPQEVPGALSLGKTGLWLGPSPACTNGRKAAQRRVMGPGSQHLHRTWWTHQLLSLHLQALHLNHHLRAPHRSHLPLAPHLSHLLLALHLNRLLRTLRLKHLPQALHLSHHLQAPRPSLPKVKPPPKRRSLRLLLKHLLPLHLFLQTRLHRYRTPLPLFRLTRPTLNLLRLILFPHLQTL